MLSDVGYLQKIQNYALDPYLLSAYTAGLFASFAWVIVIARLPLVVAFPIYIGVTFMLVMVGGWFFLSESISSSQLVAATLILIGISVGVKG